MAETVRYSNVMAMRLAPELREAIQAASAKHGVKVAEYVRNALWTAIALQGNDENPDVRADGKRRYARIEGGAIVDVIYLTEGPGDGSTTFNIPDVRGRLTPSLDNMGGAAANRITNAGSGIAGATLGAVGGAQNINIAQSGLPNVSLPLVGTPGTATGQQQVSPALGAVNKESGGDPPSVALPGGGFTPTASFTPAGNTFLNGNVTQTPTITMPPSIVCNRIMRIV